MLHYSYLYWARAAGGTWVPFAIVLAFATVECIAVSSKWWLTYWSTHGTEHNQAYFLGIYGIINLVNVIAVFLRLIFIMMLGLRASRKVGKTVNNIDIVFIQYSI